MANNVFQKTEDGQIDLFDVPGYKTLIKYMALVGQSPLQTDRDRKIRHAVFMIGNISIFLPSFVQSLLDHDLDAMMDSIPLILTLMVCTIKLDNHNKNREKYKWLFKFVHGEWATLRFNNNISILNKVADQGSFIALVYRRTLIVLLVLFLLVPLTPIFLDVVLPLNETRSRHNMFEINYVFVDSNEYFYPIYLHVALCAITSIMIIIAIDSLYMVLVYQTCGLFAICGYQIKQATELTSGTVDLYQQFKQFAITHNKAIQLYEHIHSCNQNSYLLQIGLNMVALSITAVQVLMHLGQPGELQRFGMLIAQKFHLLVLSLPGQALVDYSLELGNTIYASKWYQTPVKIQKLLYMMKVKCSKPCVLTAGGLYQMNIENFGIIVKSCMSYFMMLMSLRE